METLIGAILLAVGILVFYFSKESKKGDKYYMYMLIISIVCTVLGGWLVFHNITREMIMRKIYGLIMLLAGGFLAVLFPGATRYQNKDFAITGILIGLTLLFLGFYWLFF